MTEHYREKMGTSVGADIYVAAETVQGQDEISIEWATPSTFARITLLSLRDARALSGMLCAAILTLENREPRAPTPTTDFTHR